MSLSYNDATDIKSGDYEIEEGHYSQKKANRREHTKIITPCKQ